MLKFHTRISIGIISAILTQVFLWASTGYPIDNLRVPLNVTDQRIVERMIAEKIKAQLADIIADTVGQPREGVAQTLGQLAPEALHQAWVRRFNLNSEFFKKRFVKLWQGDSNEKGDDLEKSDALYLLTEGYIVSQQLGDRGECIINFSTIEEAEFVRELSPWLRGKKIYQSSRRNNEYVVIEWAWVPVFNGWLPVQLDSTILKTLFEDDGIITKIGAHSSGRKELNKFYEDYGENFRVCMRVGQDGHFFMSYEKLEPSGRKRGMYKRSEEAGNIVIGTIGQNGVPVEFFFAGTDAPIYPKRIVVKDSKGRDNLIESHLALDADTLHALTEKYRNFWVFFQAEYARFKIGSKAISGKLATDRPPWVNMYLGAYSTDQAYTLSITHFLQFPSEETTVQVLMIRGVPAYVQRGEQRIVLKRLESMSKDDSLPRDPIDSFVNDISSEALLKALAHASQNNLNIVATRLVCTPAGRDGGPGWNIGVVGQRIYIPSELVRQDLKYAEVVYDPAGVAYDEASGQATPIPTEVRVGHYTTDDPNKLSECRFIVDDVFSLVKDENSPQRRFMAYKKHGQLELRDMSRTDI